MRRVSAGQRPNTWPLQRGGAHLQRRRPRGRSGGQQAHHQRLRELVRQRDEHILVLTET
ncbi:unnamed protein product [Nesidiocoris tenuis]|uniref:Uncharacterized protein n=1 Tax=Nesidiocoris tenuis TaxID=355587 RepID=A0A6H5GFB5_9HEMI|nr:unnamed protein product [Nesidiocoris tenuis]